MAHAISLGAPAAYAGNEPAARRQTAAGYGDGSSRARLAGLGAVALLHIAFVYALASGLAQHAVELIKGPLETRVIQEIKPQPKDTAPPPPIVAPLPPPFIPPPEVQIRHAAPAPARAISVVTSKAPPKPVPAPPPVPVAHVSHGPSNGGRPACKDADALYPAASQDLQEEGVVTINALVDVTGAVVDTRLVKSSGFHRLDDAALNGAASVCHYAAPATADGQPHPGWTTISFNFRPAGE